MSTVPPFCVLARHIVENSMRIMVDGDDIRVAFSKDLHREALSQAVAWLDYCYGPNTLPFSL